MKKSSILLLLLISLSACISPEPSPTESIEGGLSSYENEALHYRFDYPSDWNLDTNGLENSVTKHVELTPENANPYISYFNVHLEQRDLNFLLSEVFVGIEEVNFGGQKAYSSITPESQGYIVPYQESIYVITTQTPELEDVKIILESFKFIN